MPLPGQTTGDGWRRFCSILDEVLPEGFFVDYSGQSRLEVQQGNTLLIAFGLAIVVIYLVLAAQFESFRDPLIILMSVPLSIFGAILPLNIGLGTLNIYTQVGLITLIGLITKHGILLVEFANQQRGAWAGAGMMRSSRPAKVRLRPILMTTAAMALAVVPPIRRGRRGGGALFDRHRDLHRHADRDDVHALRRTDVLHLHLAQRRGLRRREARARSTGRPPATPDGAAARTAISARPIRRACFLCGLRPEAHFEPVAFGGLCRCRSRPPISFWPAIVCEVIATSALLASEQFSRLGPSLLMLVFTGSPLTGLAQLRLIPMGIVCAIWSGFGIVLITGIGWLWFRPAPRCAGPGSGSGLIVSGVVVVHLSNSLAR